MKKAVLVTYNKLPDIPLGRHITGNVIVYSGDYGREKHLFASMQEAEKTLLNDPVGFDSQQKLLNRLAEDEVKNLSGGIRADDINEAEVIYIYIGLRAINGIAKMAETIKMLGKKIFFIACDCKKERKEELAKKLGAEIYVTHECGGRRACMLFIEEWNKK